MRDNTAIIESLRAVRGERDLIERLKEGSLEARRDRIAEALSDPDWDAGPAELIATYAHHVAARKDGVIMRIPVIEDDNSIRFGKPEIFSIPQPVSDVGEEIMSTAEAAAELVMSEDFDSASPMIRGIIGALDVKGDLQRRLSMDVTLRGLSRKTWWEDIVAESVDDDYELPEVAAESDDPKVAASEAIDGLLTHLKEGASDVVAALHRLSIEDTHPGAVECARDIAEDITAAVTVLTGVNRDDLDEMSRVFEGVGRVVPRLIKGVTFLKNLSNG